MIFSSQEDCLKVKEKLVNPVEAEKVYRNDYDLYDPIKIILSLSAYKYFSLSLHILIISWNPNIISIQERI